MHRELQLICLLNNCRGPNSVASKTFSGRAGKPLFPLYALPFSQLINQHWAPSQVVNLRMSCEPESQHPQIHLVNPCFLISEQECPLCFGKPSYPARACRQTLTSSSALNEQAVVNQSQRQGMLIKIHIYGVNKPKTCAQGHGVSQQSL